MIKCLPRSATISLYEEHINYSSYLMLTCSNIWHLEIIDEKFFGQPAPKAKASLKKSFVVSTSGSWNNHPGTVATREVSKENCRKKGAHQWFPMQLFKIMQKVFIFIKIQEIFNFSGFFKLNNNDVHKICVTKIIRILQLKKTRGDAEEIYI